MDWLINSYTAVARTLAWIGVVAIIVLSVVPATDRPVSGVGQGLEHFAAFALVGGVFAIGYRFSLMRLLVLAIFFCGGIELLQIPLPTSKALRIFRPSRDHSTRSVTQPDRSSSVHQSVQCRRLLEAFEEVEGQKFAVIYYLQSCSERSRASVSPLSANVSVERVPLADSPLSTAL
jgi:hypothetical protein